MISWKERCESALAMIRPHVVRTPLKPIQTATQNGKCFLKCENEQVTGSFKARGSCNKMLTLTPEERQKGCITSSSGNHGAGVARMAATLQTKVEIYVGEATAEKKLSKIRDFGGEFVRIETLQGVTDCVIAESKAREESETTGKTFVGPYNDVDVMAGQGTIGVEILEQLPDVECVYVAVGGGGLISGIANYLKATKPGIEIVACSAANSAALHHSVLKGHIIEDWEDPGETISDGTAGGIETGSVTLELAKSSVDRWLLLSEQEIAAAMNHVHKESGMKIEGAAGVAMAGYLQEEQGAGQGKVSAVVICGGNIDPAKFDSFVQQHGF